MMLPRAISLEELKRQGAIYIERIEEGIERYPYTNLEGSGREIFEKIYELVQENGWECSFVDFYYGRLTQEQKKVVLAQLSEEERSYLLKRTPMSHELYFPLDEKLLSITVKLTVNETLFSTFYFCKNPCTIWGNYNKKFPVFSKKMK